MLLIACRAAARGRARRIVPKYPLHNPRDILGARRLEYRLVQVRLGALIEHSVVGSRIVSRRRGPAHLFEEDRFAGVLAYVVDLRGYGTRIVRVERSKVYEAQDGRAVRGGILERGCVGYSDSDGVMLVQV